MPRSVFGEKIGLFVVVFTLHIPLFVSVFFSGVNFIN